MKSFFAAMMLLAVFAMMTALAFGATPATQPTILQPSADVVSILNSAKVGSSYSLVDNELYRLSGQVNPKAGGWTLHAGNAHLSWSVPHGTNACIRAGKPAIVIDGGNWYTASTPVEIIAPDCKLTNATIADGAERCALIESFGGAKGTGAVIDHCKIGRTLSVSIYTTQDSTRITNCSFAGSIGETTIRVDRDSITGLDPAGVTVANNTIAGGGYSKGVMEWRYAVAGQFTGNTCHDYLRVGQANQSSATSSVNGITISGNNWPDVPTTGQVATHLLMMSGTTAHVIGNDFTVDATMECADVWGPGVFTFANNRRHPSAANVTPRAKIYNPASAGGATVIDDNAPVVPYGK